MEPILQTGKLNWTEQGDGTAHLEMKARNAISLFIWTQATRYKQHMWDTPHFMQMFLTEAWTALCPNPKSQSRFSYRQTLCASPESDFLCWHLAFSKATPLAGNNTQEKKKRTIQTIDKPCSNFLNEENVVLLLKFRWWDTPVWWELTHQRSCFDWFSVLSAAQLLKGSPVVCHRISDIKISKHKWPAILG